MADHAGDEDRSSDGLVSGEAAAADVDQEDRDTDKEEGAVPEKLADDDELKEKWYRRAFFTVFPKLRRVEERRQVYSSDRARNKAFKYAVCSVDGLAMYVYVE
jgi:hypothetical protein